MKIDHLAIWVDQLEVMRHFYITYFDAVCGEKYVNKEKKYASYFLVFGQEQTRIELMTRPDIHDSTSTRWLTKGVAHFAISVGDKQAVNLLTERLRADKFVVASEPRTTGDGYYESAILDPEGNYIEIFGE